MKIDLPGKNEQREFVRKAATDEAIKQLRANLKVPKYEAHLSIDESLFDDLHLRTEENGWVAPHPEIVKAYFEDFKNQIPEYNTDEKLTYLLGLSSNRRVRAFRLGEKKVPYGVWRKFLVLTGRVQQEIIPVLGVWE